MERENSVEPKASQSRPSGEDLKVQLQQLSKDLEHARNALRQKTELLNLSQEAIMVLDAHGRIVSWNQGAEKLYGWREDEVLGLSPVELLKTELPRPLPQIETILRNEGHWEYELRKTARDGRVVSVLSRWYEWHDYAGNRIGRFLIDTDITRRRQAEQDLRALSGRLLNLRDEERRRLARDLHDSVGQLLAVAKMCLSSVPATGLEPNMAELLSQATDLVSQAMTEIRTLSYLLHPPLLDEAGLVSALPWFISGFAERSQIKVELEVPEDLGRFTRELEMCIFRIVQESLTNIHRHSGSPTAKITLSKLPHQIRLKVEDQGKGMPLPEKHNKGATPGVGISGIRERVRQLGGHMQIRSGAWGTAVEAIFPIKEFTVSSPTDPKRRGKAEVTATDNATPAGS